MTTRSLPDCVPTTQEIHAVFVEEATALGGTVCDAVLTKHMLYTRAIFPRQAEVRPGDRFSPGIALRGFHTALQVHPYVVRQICTNGAIGEWPLESRRLHRRPVVDVPVQTSDVVAMLEALRTAVRACAANEEFAKTLAEIGAAPHHRADIPFVFGELTRMGASATPRLRHEILKRFASDGDQSAFGLMNAVTSVARDTVDAEVRWQLERLGARIPARLRRQPRPSAVTVESSAPAEFATVE